MINGSQLQDLIPVDNSWTNNVISGMPLYATATPDPNATPTPIPLQKGEEANKISGLGNMKVENVPAKTGADGTFSVYGFTNPNSYVTATAQKSIEEKNSAVYGFINSAIADSSEITLNTVQANENGLFEMNVKLPEPGDYIVKFASDSNNFATYGVTYDTGATPMPTPAPLPTVAPVEEEDGGMGILPFVIGGLLIVIAAAVYGVYVYRRKSEEEEEDDEDLDDETEMRQAQLNMQRQRAASVAPNASAAPKTPAAPQAPASTVIPGAQRMPKAPSSASSEVPAYMKNAQRSPYARPEAPVAPVAPKAPEAPKAPVMPQAPKAPAAPVAPAAPEMPKAQAAQADETASTPRRRRRPPVDPQA